ncbi:hypothetical protein [Mesorhizobium sp. CN2-181]|uniref:hypothetical protein n=1 Tax=Mesorhizobium yinganensis TaxID=3157707 RepID=UPI0032B74287
MKEPLRASLEAAAKRLGHSMNSEIVRRLERSFVDDDLFSSQEIHIWAILLAEEFHKAGSSAAAHADDDTADRNWRGHPDYLMLATLAVMRSLVRDFVRLPGVKGDDVVFLIDQLKSGVASELVYAGKAKWVDKDGKEIRSGFIGDDDAR